MSYKFLVVDDTSFMRKMAADCLKQYGHNVVGEAINGKEAIRKYNELQPDVVMMDLTMPEMNGVVAIKEILKINKEAVILVCSANNQKDMIQEALDAGAVGYLMKPFKPDYMNEIIKKYAEPHLKVEETEPVKEETSYQKEEPATEEPSHQKEEPLKAESSLQKEEAKKENDDTQLEAAQKETEEAKFEAAASVEEVTEVQQTVEKATTQSELKNTFSQQPQQTYQPAEVVSAPKSTRENKIKFTTSYICNWEEAVQGEKKNFSATFTENDQNVCIEMTDSNNTKQKICLSLDGFLALNGWLEQRLEEQ